MYLSIFPNSKSSLSGSLMVGDDQEHYWESDLHFTLDLWNGHSWQRVLIPPPAIIPPPLFFKFCSTSNHLLPPPPLFFLLPDFSDWIGDHISFNMCFAHLESCYFSTRRTLLCVLCNKVSSLLRSDTYCSLLLVLWFDMTQTHEDTYHSQGPIDWHTYINIY